MKSTALQTLLDQGQVWAGQLSAKSRGRPTGFAALDRQLAQGGWPAHGIVEIQSTQLGLGELQLLLPSLQTEQQRLWVWLDPPFQPCAQGLAQAPVALSQCLILRTNSQADALWAAERCLQSGCVDSLLSWFRQAPAMKSLRRLQMAAETGRALLHLMHDSTWQLDSSTHARLNLSPTKQAGRIQVHIQRQRGGPQQPALELPLLGKQAQIPARPKPANAYPPTPPSVPQMPAQQGLALCL